METEIVCEENGRTLRMEDVPADRAAETAARYWGMEPREYVPRASSGRIAREETSGTFELVPSPLTGGGA